MPNCKCKGTAHDSDCSFFYKPNWNKLIPVGGGGSGAVLPRCPHCSETEKDGILNTRACFNAAVSVIQSLSKERDEWKRRAEFAERNNRSVLDDEFLRIKAERDRLAERLRLAEADEKTRCKCQFGQDHREVKICEWHQFIVQQGIEDGKKTDALAERLKILHDALMCLSRDGPCVCPPLGPSGDGSRVLEIVKKCYRCVVKAALSAYDAATKPTVSVTAHAANHGSGQRGHRIAAPRPRREEGDERRSQRKIHERGP